MAQKAIFHQPQAEAIPSVLQDASSRRPLPGQVFRRLRVVRGSTSYREYVIAAKLRWSIFFTDQRRRWLHRSLTVS